MLQKEIFGIPFKILNSVMKFYSLMVEEPNDREVNLGEKTGGRERTVQTESSPFVGLDPGQCKTIIF